jgi:hypothetical protein
VNSRIEVVVVSILATVVWTPTIETSAQQGKVGVVDTLEGSVSITRHAAESRSLASNEDVFTLDRIVTGNDSKARIRFAADASVLLGDRSVVTISEESGSHMLDLDNGAVYYRVSPEENQGDEPRAVRTPNAIARATGGLVVRVSRESATVIVTTVCVLAGQGSAAVLAGARIDVPEGNCVAIDGSTLGTVFPLPPTIFPLSPTPVPPPLTHIIS